MNNYERYKANKKQYEPELSVNTNWNKHKQEYLKDLKYRLRALVSTWVSDYSNEEDKELNDLIVRTINEEYKHLEMLLYSFPQYKQPYKGN